MAMINNKIYALLAASAISISALEIACAASRQPEAQSKLQQIRHSVPPSVFAKSGEMIRKYSKIEVRKCIKDNKILFEVASGSFDPESLSHSEYMGFTEQGEYLFSSSVTDGSKELGMPLVSQGYVCDVLFAESGIR